MLPVVAESDALPPKAEPPTPTAHILVVDDDNDVLKTTLRLLRVRGFNVLGAENGSEALRELARNPAIDLIVADCAMPEMNGIDFARTVSGLRPSLPFILMTGNFEIDPSKEIAGMRILQKPCAEGELVEEIAKALS